MERLIEANRIVPSSFQVPPRPAPPSMLVTSVTAPDSRSIFMSRERSKYATDFPSGEKNG